MFSVLEDSFDTVLERGMAISYGVSGSLGIGSSLFARMVDDIQTASSSDGMPEFSVVRVSTRNMHFICI